MSTVLWMIVSFVLGAMFGIFIQILQIRHSCRTSYLLGWNDAIKYYTNRSKGDDD